jgi:hypothetical protein
MRRNFVRKFGDEIRTRIATSASSGGCRESFVENQEKKTRKKMIRGRWDFGSLLIIIESGGGGGGGAERVGEMGFFRSDGGSKVAHKTTQRHKEVCFPKDILLFRFAGSCGLDLELNFFFFVYSNHFFLEPFS